ncbi:hypothetical protein BN14_08687 [Rhizoctonia solani AG-1 IB]|uniref:Uncharacterized protein n=1 Tax=Thanatephorus cucumeris (strain AG1-IB / isolate 7/3/14) TaxID=1108050 RepID=M5C3Q9_THACB|nr:hypothetical protein BN14_08687 [Rhizoctonia solani AG-1 IB]
MLLPPANGPSRPRAPSDANKPSSSRTSLSFMLNPNTEGKVASGSKGNGQRPSELKNISTNVPAPIHHVTPPTPVAPASMEKAQAAPPSMQMDIDVPTPTSRDPPTSPSSSTSGTMGGMTDLSRRPSRKRSASPENYGPEREDSPGRESVSSLGNAHIQAPHTTPPHTHARPPRTPSSEFGPGPSPTATSASASESFARPMSAESPGRPINREAGVAYRDPTHHESVSPTRRESGPSSHREPPVHRDAAPPHRDPSKQASISTALADIHLKSAGTSRASSPGHGRHDVFVHSAFNGPGSGRHAWTTFGTAGENMASSEGRAVAAVAVGDTRAPAASEGRMANVWRHETEAGMRRREAEAELRKQESQGHVDLHRRRSEGAKRRKIGDSEDEHRAERERGMSGATDERRMSIVEPERRSSGAESDRRMSIVEPERRMSIVEPDKHPVSDPEKRTSMAEPERRMSIVEPEKRMTGVETERNNSIPESGRRLSIVEHVRRATGVAPKDSGHRATSNSLPNPRATTAVDAFARSRRGSVPMPGAWTDDPKSQSVIVISDSPEAQTGDTEMDIPEQPEPLFPDRSTVPDTKSDSTEGSRAAAEESTPLERSSHET